MAEEMEHLARDLLPLASPIMDYLHQRFLQHYVEQDLVGHMEIELDDSVDLGRLRIVIAFADLAGYTRFTEEEGEEEALSYVERFIDAVHDTLPDDARVIKTIGDEVMVVGERRRRPCSTGPSASARSSARTARRSRIGLHVRRRALPRRRLLRPRRQRRGSRVVARAARRRGARHRHRRRRGHRAADHLEFEDIGQVKLKGFDEPRLLFRAHLRTADG